MRALLTEAGVETMYIQPGAAWENGSAASLGSRFRDELLECEEFGGLLEARVRGKQGQEQDNTARPHSALGYGTPAEFAASCPRADSAKPPPACGHDGDG